MPTKNVGIKFLVQNKQLYIFSFRIVYKHTSHGVDVYPVSAAGVPFTAAYIAAKGDPIANLQEDLAAEQKARATYEKLIDICRDNPDVLDPLKFLRQREIVHFQRFGEALRGVQDKLAEKKYYMNDNSLKMNQVIIHLVHFSHIFYPLKWLLFILKAFLKHLHLIQYQI